MESNPPTKVFTRYVSNEPGFTNPSYAKRGGSPRLSAVRPAPAGGEACVRTPSWDPHIGLARGFVFVGVAPCPLWPAGVWAGGVLPTGLAN
jgi:hypothetical protein